MSTLNVNFAFLSNAQSFVSTAGAASVLSWDGIIGNPLGSLKTILSGSNKSDNNSWKRTLTYENLGVPANSIISAITSVSLDSRCTAFSGGTGCTSGSVTLQDGATTITLSTQRTITAVGGSFLTTTGIDATGLSKASSNSIVLTIPNHLGTTSGGSGKGVTLYQDNLNFTITYTTAYNLIGSKGLFTEIGNSTVFGLKSSFLSGSFVEIGNNATLGRTLYGISLAGSFIETGNDVIFYRSLYLIVSSQTFIEIGYATLIASFISEAGLFNIIDNDVNFFIEDLFEVLPDSFIIETFDNNIFVNRNLIVDPGIFIETGNDTTYLTEQKIVHICTEFFIEANDAILTRGRSIENETGNYVGIGPDNNFNITTKFESATIISSSSETNLIHSVDRGRYDFGISLLNISRSIFDPYNAQSLSLSEPLRRPILLSLLTGGLFRFQMSDNLILGNLPDGKDCKILSNQCVATGLNTQAGYSAPCIMIDERTVLIQDIIDTPFYNGSQVTLYNLSGGHGDNRITGVINNVSVDDTLNATIITFKDISTIHTSGFIALNSNFQAFSSGESTIASAPNSYAGGKGAIADLPGKFSRSDSYFNTPGDGQYSSLACGTITLNNTPKYLDVDGNIIKIRNNMSYFFVAFICARQLDGSNNALFFRYGIIKNIDNNITLDGTIAILGTDINTPGWDVELEADSGNGLEIEVTGAIADEVHWKARIDCVEIG